jgi:hypothetical protein
MATGASAYRDSFIDAYRFIVTEFCTPSNEFA